MRPSYVFAWLGVLTLLAVTCHGQPPRDMSRNRTRGSRDTLFRLLGMSPVRDELGLRSLQVQMLDDLQADLSEQRRAAFSSQFENLGDPLGAVDPEKAGAARLDAFQKTREQGERLIAVILDPEQVRRLHELRLQDEGTRALDRRELRARLQVTDEQFEKIQAVRRAEDDPALPRVRRQKKLDASVLALLTETQQAALKELQGAPFEFPLAVPPDLRGLRGPLDSRRPQRPSN